MKSLDMHMRQYTIDEKYFYNNITISFDKPRRNEVTILLESLKAIGKY